MIRYKIDVLAELKKMGYTQTRLQKENLIPNQTITNIKNGKSITLITLNTICIMLKCQPGDVIECIPTPEEIVKFY